MKEEKRQEKTKSIFLEVAIRFLIIGLEDLKKDSINKDSSLFIGWTQGTTLSEKKRGIATETVIELGKFIPQDDDEQNNQALEQLLSTCRTQAKNLSLQAKKKDQGTFGPAMQKIELFLKQFHDTLTQCSGYCLLKVKTNPLKSYEHIEVLTGIQKTIIFCENDEKFYYKDTINKLICYIEAPTEIQDTQNEEVLCAHKKLVEGFNQIPCEQYRKATPEELDLIFLVTDKKACNFLDIVYDKNDAYSLYLYHMTHYLAQIIYDGTSVGLIKKFVHHFVPEIDKVPEIVDKLEQCHGDLIILNREMSNYQATKVKIVLGSLEQLKTGNKELVHEAGLDPSVNFSVGFMTKFTVSTRRIESSEGRLGERITLATEEIKLSNRKILNQVQKIKISNQTPLILNSNNPGKNNNTKMHTGGIKVLPEYPHSKFIKPHHANQTQPVEEDEYQTSSEILQQTMFKKDPNIKFPQQPTHQQKKMPQSKNVPTLTMKKNVNQKPFERVINQPNKQQVSEFDQDTEAVVENNLLIEVTKNKNFIENKVNQVRGNFNVFDEDEQAYAYHEETENTEEGDSLQMEGEGEQENNPYANIMN